MSSASSNQIDPPGEDAKNKELEEELKKCRDSARKQFWRVASKGFWRYLEEAPNVWPGPEGRFYRQERAMVQKHAEPFYWGAFVTLFLFTTFRVSGSRFYSRFREKLFPPKKQASTTTTTSPVKTQRPQWKSYLDKQAERTAERTKVQQKDLFELPLDILISLSCGCSTVIFLLPTAEIQKDFVAAPLSPGKSLLSDLLCPGMEQVLHQSVDPRILTPNLILSPSGGKSDSLAVFLAFCRNCRTRNEYIAYQEQQQKIRRPNVIPYPGLEGVRR